MIPETPMKIYDLFFWAAAFFLLGALAASFVKSFALAAAGVLAAALLFAVLSFVFEKKNFFAFSFLIFRFRRIFSLSFLFRGAKRLRNNF